MKAVTPTWGPVLAAAVAVIGTLAAAIFTQMWTARREDRRRGDDQAARQAATEREDQFRLYQERRAAYVHYLKALHDGSEAIRAVALGEYPAGLTRESAAGAGFRNAGIYAAREDVVLLAKVDLALAAREAFYRVRDLRDLASQEIDVKSPEYQEALDRYRRSLSNLRAAMRQDLEIPALGAWREIGYDL